MCGSDITLSNYFENKLSPVAVSVGNHTFHDVPDVLVQELENPFGIKFHVATLKQAHCAITESNVCYIIIVPFFILNIYVASPISLFFIDFPRFEFIFAVDTQLFVVSWVLVENLLLPEVRNTFGLDV